MAKAVPKILIVDDEPAQRAFLSEFLEGAGFVAVPASDGEEALRRLSAEPGAFRVMLTDLAMPGMDGLALATRARTVAPEVDVVVMTAYASVESAIQALKA